MSMQLSTHAWVASGLRLDADGAEHVPAALCEAELTLLRALADATLNGGSGVRVFGGAALRDALRPAGRVGHHACAVLGAAARPVRAVMFDKTATTNWAVAWHQDRTIAVRAQCEAPGFGPWTIKAGVPHVEPPFDILAGMVTLRVHLDDCGQDNAPLLVVPGSHRLGQIPGPEAPAVAQRLGHAACLAAAGDIWVYATPIVHASERSRNPIRRRVLQVDYANRELPCGLAWAGVAGAAAWTPRPRLPQRVTTLR